MARPATTSWFRKPIWLGIVGLVLMVGGVKLSSFLPSRPADHRLSELRSMAPDREYAETLERYADGARGEPPYRVPGRLGFLAGLVMFSAAAFQMYHAKPGPPPDEDPEPDEDDDD